MVQRIQVTGQEAVVVVSELLACVSVRDTGDPVVAIIQDRKGLRLVRAGELREYDVYHVALQVQIVVGHSAPGVRYRYAK